jgi:dinuclear metal center YbgI/SA1388 family protein
MAAMLRHDGTGPGVSLTALTRYLTRYLSIRSIADIPGVVNGLQHQNSGRIDCLVAAVDACQASLNAAASSRRALLVVHHGLSMDHAPRGPAAARARILRESDVALFACHIPLDLHAVVGNNVLLGRRLGLRGLRPFGRYGRRRIGVEGRLGTTVSALVDRLDRLLGSRAYVVRGGDPRVSRVAIVTGNGTRWLTEAREAGIGTLVTGEAGHHDALNAEELGINLVCAGHYATETLGVRALAAHIGSRFGLPWAFFDHPTGL